MSKDSGVILNFIDEHVDLSIPLEHLILNVCHLESETWGGRVLLSAISKEPELCVWTNMSLIFDLIEGNLRCDDLHSSVDVEDLNVERDLVIVDFERDLVFLVLWVLSATWSGVTVLVTLVADNVRVVDLAAEVFSADESDVEHAHWSTDVISVLSLGLFELFFGLLKPIVVDDDGLLDLSLTLDKLVLGLNVQR